MESLWKGLSRWCWNSVEYPRYFSEAFKLQESSNLRDMSKDSFTHKVSPQSLSTYPHADGKSGEILFSTKHLWRSMVKQHCSILLNNWLEKLSKYYLIMILESQGFLSGSFFPVVFFCFRKSPCLLQLLRRSCHAVLLWSSRNVL